MKNNVMHSESAELLSLLEAFGVPINAYNGWLTKFSFVVEANEMAVITLSYSVPNTSINIDEIKTIVDQYNLTRKEHV